MAGISVSKICVPFGAGGGGGIDYASYWATRISSVFGANLVAYFPCNDESGTTITEVVNSYNATSANVTMNQSGPINTKSALWGATSYSDVYTAGTHLSTEEGTIIMFIKVAESIWDDASWYRFVHLRYTGVVDEFSIYKSGINRALYVNTVRNSTSKTSILYYPRNPNWLCVALTWSTTGNKMEGFINGVKFHDLGTTTAIGTHSGAVLRADLAGLGSGRGGSSEYSVIGGISNVIFLSKATNETELQSLFDLDQIIFDGDSRTNIKPWPVISIGDNFISPRNVGIGGARVYDMLTTALTNVDPKIRSGKKNICFLWGGVNDSASSTAAIYNRIKTYCEARKTAGFTVIVCTEIDAQDAASVANGWNAKMLALNILLRADHSFADGFVDLGLNANLMDATNLTYFLADQIHLTDAGYLEVAGVAAPVIDNILASM